MPEWPIGTALKAVAGRDVSRGFESRPLCWIPRTRHRPLGENRGGSVREDGTPSRWKGRMSAQRNDQDPGDEAARADAARCAAARRLLVPRSGVDSPDHLCALALRLLGADLAQVSVRCADEVVVSRFGTAGKTGSRLEAPVTSADGVHVVGALTVLAGADRVWTEEDRTTLDVLAAGVAAELERAAALVERQGLQQRLAVALDSAGIGSWELDLASREFRGDARLLEMFGIPADSQEVRISAVRDPDPARAPSPGQPFPRALGGRGGGLRRGVPRPAARRLGALGRGPGPSDVRRRGRLHTPGGLGLRHHRPARAGGPGRGHQRAAGPGRVAPARCWPARWSRRTPSAASPGWWCRRSPTGRWSAW